jgi:hypothetical protein
VGMSWADRDRLPARSDAMTSPNDGDVGCLRNADRDTMTSTVTTPAGDDVRVLLGTR